MPNVIYFEKSIADHPRTRQILARYKGATHIAIDRYGEVFNGHKQNFRVQKASPSLILAEKNNERTHPTPAQHETGGGAHYYFSHMLNCLYDCRYCFLQGMFRSANYLLFVNYEDFITDIKQVAESHTHNSKPTWFYSGYDCDSLAYEPVTGFAEYFIDAFAQVPNSVLELRTKSTQIRPLLRRLPQSNVVVAASLSPSRLAEAIEHGAPSTLKRLDALAQLQKQGWRIGLRLDPVIWCDDFRLQYQELLELIGQRLDFGQIDSLTLGSFRVPKGFFKQMHGLYPEEPMFNLGMETKGSMVSYRDDIESQSLSFVFDLCCQFINPERVFINGALSNPS